MPSETCAGVREVAGSSTSQQQLAQVRTEILKIFNDDAYPRQSGPRKAVMRSNTISDEFAVTNQDEEDLTVVPQDTIEEKHETEECEKNSSIEMANKSSRVSMMSKGSSMAWSSEDAADGASSNTGTGTGTRNFGQQYQSADNDSGIDRDGAVSKSSDKIWTKIHKQLNRRFGGSTGSLSSSPFSEQETTTNVNNMIRKSSAGDLYSPSVAQLESPREGGFDDNDQQPRSMTAMKAHIRELMSQLAKSEEDKQKIAEEAYLKAMEIQTEAKKELASAHKCQSQQTSLIDRLKVRKIFPSLRG